MKIELALAALTAGCGSKTLDIGGPAGGADSGAPGDPAPGTHSTVLIPHQRQTTGLASDGAYLYWSTREELTGDSTGEIRRCDKQDCPATQQTLVRAPTGNLLIRNERLYFALQGSIVSCPVNDCTVPTVIVVQGASPSIVDDSHVYWRTVSDNAFLSCPLTGCEKATAAPVTGIGTIVLGYGADDLNLYWVSGESDRSKYSIKSAPKNGSALPNVLVSGLIKPASFIVDGGFVYWATLDAEGTIARCPTSGCSGGTPEVLLDQQYYPHYLAISDGVLFWLNETDPRELTAINRPAKLLGCVAASCAETVEVLDESRGGSLIDPIHALSFPPQQMVIDSEAVYWIGDFTNISPSASMVTAIDVSIRRLPRKPGK
jgi:hypothetical protein